MDEEEADRAAAVQEVVTVLSGDIAGSLLESLKSEVDTLVEELRLEVAVGSERDQEREVEQALQVCIAVMIVAKCRMNSSSLSAPDVQTHGGCDSSSMVAIPTLPAPSAQCRVL